MRRFSALGRVILQRDVQRLDDRPPLGDVAGYEAIDFFGHATECADRLWRRSRSGSTGRWSCPVVWEETLPSITLVTWRLLWSRVPLGGLSASAPYSCSR